MEAEIEAIASNGAGFFRHEGRAVFVPWTVPSDRVRWRVTREKKRYFEGAMEELLEPSQERVIAPCPWFKRCGGCQLQMASQAAQLRAKSQWIYDAFTRIGCLELPHPPEVRAAEDYAYRRRIVMRVAPGPNGLGLAFSGTKDREWGEGPQEVFPDFCLLLSPEPVMQEINALLRDYPSVEEGWRGTAAIFQLDGQFSLWLRVKSGAPALLKCLSPLLERSHWAALAIEQDGELLQQGQWALHEEFDGVRFVLSPGGFLQGHRSLSRRLWRDVVQWATQSPGPILDLYSGIGVTALLCAKQGHQVTMVEADPALVAAAEQTLLQPDVQVFSSLVRMEPGFVEDVLPRIEPSAAHTILLNPPRPGCSTEALKEVLRLSPSRISYVSCHPASCARDLARLPGYRIDSVVGYDLFPQTAHVECWVTLSKE
jgi:23S rRNA (uracil1939-C5)-methyltransferase